ncbi:M15 family metallopeptidase [uncultured Parabacteroides sp.]|uniref:M15 family metallopeptidase n=1 Tax=uncultured Parabacteroides sp. TaxID=512312 RepID=UPI002623557C|nr:M15 family metallopeptidase [uncultured Parabacteroides sp.]
MVLVDEYNADDERSMQANNSSSFNFRFIHGTSKLSTHSMGYAIDINPKYNPYVKESNGKIIYSPENAKEYIDRSANFPYKIDHNDLCFKEFKKRGFTWGGDWSHLKDYQHFEKTK